MGALILPSRFSQQPQQAVPVDPSIRADFAWLASVPKASLAGPAISSSTAGQLATARGLAINSGYAVVAAPVPSLYSTTWTEIGSVLLDGTNQVTPLSARNEGQAVRFIPASALIDLVMWGVADVNISGALPVGVVHYVARRVGNTHTIWLNGRLYGAASSASAPTASAGTLPAVGAQAGNGGSAGGTPLAATTGVLAVVRTGLALPDALCQQLSANPYQGFVAPPRRLWAASGAPGGVNASLGAVLGGVSLASAASAGMASSLSRTLSPATLNMTASSPLSAMVTKALAPVALVGAGSLSTNAALAQTLAPTTLAANGTVAQPGAGPGAIQASLNATLAPATLAASSNLALSGRLTRTLDGAALGAVAGCSSAANVSVTLAPATLEAGGAVAAELQLAGLLDAATLSASARLFILDGLPTPPERTVRVAGEVRAYSIPADGRSSSVSSNAGHLSVAAEPRTLH